MEVEEIAEILYNAWHKSKGDVDANSRVTPTWDTYRADGANAANLAAWLAAAAVLNGGV